MLNLLYITSTLTRCGPNNQLLYILKHLDKQKFKIHIITLSKEPADSMITQYIETGAIIHQLKLSRVRSFLIGIKKINELIATINPHIVHTQGLRPDTLISKLRINVPWISTSRNYPWHDYPMKFGKLKGYLMAWRHISALKKCKIPIACSNSIRSQLLLHEINAFTIQNGVMLHNNNYPATIDFGRLPRPVFISVDSLIYRKNMEFIIDAFNQFSKDNDGSLVILGDGPLMPKLKTIANPNVFFLGDVTNVFKYLSESDLFLSASRSEGLPNTVLEALAAGLPVMLSDIPPHKEIDQECSEACTIFKIDSTQTLTDKMIAFRSKDWTSAKKEAHKIGNQIFSAERMAKSYEALYLKSLRLTNDC